MRTAIVCGAGVAGLATSIALAMQGWSVVVYERSTAVREIGAGIFVKWNGLRVLRHFGLLDRLRADCVVLREARTLDKDGEILQRRILRDANPVWNIQRQNLIRALLDRAVALGVQVHTDAAADSLGADGTVSIGARQHQADLVIGADGVNSVARRTLGLDRPAPVPSSGAIRLQVPRGEHESADVVREFWSGRLRIGVSPCTATAVFCYLIAPLSDTRGAHTPIDADYWAMHFPRLTSEGLFERAAVAGGIHHAYPFVRTRGWSVDRAALVGDAAHALPPPLGQGAGLSLTNAVLLAQYVSAGSDIPDALRSWERDWRWVSDRTQAWARRYDWITSEWPPHVYALRDGVIWGLGKLPGFNTYMRVADRVDAPRRLVLHPGGAQPIAAPAAESGR